MCNSRIFKNKKRYLLNSTLGVVGFSVFCFSGAQAWAQNTLPNPNNYPQGRPTLSCVHEAALSYRVPTDLLLGIQSVERGETGQSVRNTNATHDLGAFQINTIHLPRIQRMGGTYSDVLNKGCYNAKVAAMLLSEALRHPSKQHLDFYTRASGYHSWTPRHNNVYRGKLVRYTLQWQNWLVANRMGHLVGSPRF